MSPAAARVRRHDAPAPPAVAAPHGRAAARRQDRRLRDRAVDAAADGGGRRADVRRPRQPRSLGLVRRAHGARPGGRSTGRASAATPYRRARLYPPCRRGGRCGRGAAEAARRPTPGRSTTLDLGNRLDGHRERAPALPGRGLRPPLTRAGGCRPRRSGRGAARRAARGPARRARRAPHPTHRARRAPRGA